jgi:hypothetical protein
MTWFTVVVIVILVLAWRMLPALVDGYRGKKGGSFAALGMALGKKLKR